MPLIVLYIIVDAAYPREGTVTNKFCCLCSNSEDAAYPREGTVTLFRPRLRTFSLMQLIPARGRLRVADAFDGFHDEMQLSPARGLRPYVSSGKFPPFY